MRHLVTLAICLPWALSVPLALSCEPTYEQMERSAERDRAIEESYLLQLAAAADLIVIGRVVDVEDAVNEDFAQKAIISVDKVLKGSDDIAAASALMHEIRPPNTDTDPDAPMDFSDMPECDAPYEPQNEIPYIIKGIRGLFYIQDGVLERVNAFPIQPELLRFNAENEIEFLETWTSG